MKYEKPQITLSADAVEVIHGSKTGGVTTALRG